MENSLFYTDNLCSVSYYSFSKGEDESLINVWYKDKIMVEHSFYLVHWPNVNGM